MFNLCYIYIYIYIYNNIYIYIRKSVITVSFLDLRTNKYDLCKKNYLIFRSYFSDRLSLGWKLFYHFHFYFIILFYIIFVPYFQILANSVCFTFQLHTYKFCTLTDGIVKNYIKKGLKNWNLKNKLVITYV
jgi:hypothetical protein